MTFPFLKVTKFPNDVLFFHRISLQNRLYKLLCALGKQIGTIFENTLPVERIVCQVFQ